MNNYSQVYLKVPYDEKDAVKQMGDVGIHIQNNGIHILRTQN